MDDDQVTLLAGVDELGTWSPRECDIAPTGKGAFRLALGGEELIFTPSSPSSFAEALQLPLQPETIKPSTNPVPTPAPAAAPVAVDVEEPPAPKYDYDAAIDELVAQVKPLKSINDEDDILSKPMLATIMVVAGALMVGLIGMTLML
jgi:hypothetical protein